MTPMVHWGFWYRVTVTESARPSIRRTATTPGLLDMMGGFTQQVRQPDSWEGWYWAPSMYGPGFQGMLAPNGNLVKDISEHTELTLFWGCDPETTPWGFTGQYATRICQFWRRAGIEAVYICPDLNYGAAIHAGQVDPRKAQHRRSSSTCHHLHLGQGRHLGQGICGHPRRGYGQDRGLCSGEVDGTPKTPKWARRQVRCFRHTLSKRWPASSPSRSRLSSITLAAR